SLPDPLQSLRRRLGITAEDSPRLQLKPEHAPIRRVVVDDQDPLTGELARAGQGLRRRGRVGGHGGDGEVKRRALAGLALDPDAPAHQLTQTLADGQAEAGPAVAARRRHVDLAERLEEAVE